MADLVNRLSNNATGRFYVADNCIDCHLCQETAPNHFRRSDDTNFSYVYNQPKTQEEIDLCMEALEGCPVEAIGDDGDQ